MRKLLTILAVVSILAVSFIARAEMIAVGDNDLDAIAGKAGNTLSADSTSLEISGGNGDIQVGTYQWSDNHQADASNQKAANFFNSTTNGGNQAQQNVVAAINEINWGAAANSNTTLGTATFGNSAGGSIGTTGGAGTAQGDIDIETWGTLYVGGF